MPANSQSNTLPACAFRDVKRSFAIPSSPFGLVGIFQPTGFLTSTAFTAYSVRNAATGMVLYNDVFGNTVPGTDIKIADWGGLLWQSNYSTAFQRSRRVQLG